MDPRIFHYISFALHFICITLHLHLKIMPCQHEMHDTSRFKCHALHLHSLELCQMDPRIFHYISFALHFICITLHLHLKIMPRQHEMHDTSRFKCHALHLHSLELCQMDPRIFHYISFALHFICITLHLHLKIMPRQHEMHDTSRFKCHALHLHFMK